MSPRPSPYCPSCGAQAGNARFCPTCGASRNHDVRSEPTHEWARLTTTSGNPVPLLGVALGGEVFGAHARLTLRQRYKNREDQPIEAVYTFPIPGDATLVGFAMECEGRRIEAEVKEREEAFAKYDEALSKGHGAALLEQERPNIFTANVGNLLPDEETVVEVTFLLKLTADEGALRLMIPTLVAPRYIPGTPTGDRTGHGAASPTNKVPDADRITPKIGDARYGISLDVLFDLGRDIDIESPSHKIDVIGEGGFRKRVTFVWNSVALDRDIVLVAEGAGDKVAGIVCDKRDDEEGTFALTLVPDLFEAKKRSKGRAVVFVVDVSGSMAGDSIEQAKRAMRLCLRHLSEGDLFEILPFSSNFSSFSGRFSGGRRGHVMGPVLNGPMDMTPFTQTTLRQADEFVESLRASGGTEMLSPLSAAAQLLSELKRDRIIVLLTDGQVGNEREIVDIISKQATKTRLYTFGIGTNVSDWLLRELASRTKGAVEFIHPGERIDEKVTAQFARATAARVDDLKVKWVGVDAGEVAPAEPPPLIDGEPWSVYGRYEEAGRGSVEIRGSLGGEPFFMEVPLSLAERADRPALTSLWAGARVKDLEAVDVTALGRRAETHKKRIVDLCIRHQIASKHTSFVVVEKRKGDRRAQGMPETRAVPVNAPAGWAMTGQRSDMAEGYAMTRAGTLRGRTGAMPARPMSRSSSMIGGAPPPPAYAPAPRMAPGAPPPPMGAPMQTGAPPPPMAAFGAPPPAPSAAMPMSAIRGEVAESPKGGFFERAKKALGLSKEKSDSASFAAPAKAAAPGRLDAMPAEPARSLEMAEMAADEEAADEPGLAEGGATSGDIGGMFARQLASGLWEEGDSSDKGRLDVTTACLLRCLKESVDSSHSIYGAQVVKAVEALTALAESFAQKGTEVDLVRKALLVCAAVSTGKRAKKRLAGIAKDASSATVKEIASDLEKQDLARSRLD